MPNGAKYWVFTLNNYSDDDEARIAGFSGEDWTYVCYGRERGESGTPHLQGYLQLARKKTLAWLRRAFSPAHPHFEVARGTPDQARECCSKDGDFVEFGSFVGVTQGRRTDLARVGDRILAGAAFDDIAREFPSVILRYSRGVRELVESVRSGDRNGEPPVLRVNWGGTGLGKTRQVFDAEPNVWVHPGGPWFDGYAGQEAVLFDDFSGSDFKLSYLLRLLDRYRMTVPIKGGFVKWIPKRIYITSNIDPRDWCPNALHAHREALLRRLQEFGSIHHYAAPFA